MKTLTKPTNLEPFTITSAELCDLTGLTDRRHRQLAERGYFPAPINGIYQREQALKGLFQYFREDRQHNDASLAEEIRLKTRAERQLRELELAKGRGEVIEIATVDQVWSNHIVYARRIILGSALTPDQQDSILTELESFKVSDVEAEPAQQNLTQ